MRIPKRGEKGFTLIELLIVVAILGVLAAVIIPNVSRFFGAGEEESRKTEKASVQLAVGMMLVDNDLSSTPNNDFDEATAGVDGATNDMSVFPDTSSLVVTADKLTDPEGSDYAAADGDGYVLYDHDITGGTAGANINYLPSATTEYYYTIDASGIVHQYETADASQPEL